MEDKKDNWLISADEFAKMPLGPMTLVDVLDAMITYSPDYMHGLPKKLYIRCLERMIEAEKCK